MSRLRDEVSDLVGSLASPLRALGVALAGMWIAWRWLAGDYLPPILLVAGVILVAYICDAIGQKLLPERPVGGLRFLEWLLAAPLALGALASAGLVLLSVKLLVPEGTPADRKELIGALTSGLTTFMTSVFISWAGDQDDSRLAKRIQRVFFSKYTRFDPKVIVEKGIKYFAPESLGEQLVHSEAIVGVEGWGREARRTRATELAAELRSGGSDPPLTPPPAIDQVPPVQVPPPPGKASKPPMRLRIHQ